MNIESGLIPSRGVPITEAHEMRKILPLVCAKTPFILACATLLRSQIEAQTIGPDTVASSIKGLEWRDGALGSTSIKEAIRSVGLPSDVKLQNHRLHGTVQVIYSYSRTSRCKCRRNW